MLLSVMKEENRTTREKIQNKSIKVKNSWRIKVCLSCYLLALLLPFLGSVEKACGLNYLFLSEHLCPTAYLSRKAFILQA